MDQSRLFLPLLARIFPRAVSSLLAAPKEPTECRLIYKSKAVGSMTPEMIAEILEQSRQNNALDGITGLLIFSKGHFCQVLEGPDAKVKRCIERVSHDTRHNAVTIISEREITSRAFSSWFMGYQDVSVGNLSSHQNVLEIDEIEKRLEVVEKMDDVAASRKVLVGYIAAFLEQQRVPP